MRPGSVCSFTDQLLSRKLALGINVLKYVRLFGQCVCGGESGGGCPWPKEFWVFCLALLSF